MILTQALLLLQLLLLSSSVTGFDPLQLQSKISVKQYRRYQEVEIKHGRVAMLAVTGILVAENWHPVAPLVTGPAITHLQQIFNGDPAEQPIKTYRALIQLSVMGILELKSIIASFETIKDMKGRTKYTGFLKEDYIIGDEGFDPLGFYDRFRKFEVSEAEDSGLLELSKMRFQEVVHGRVAMLAVVSIFAQENFYHLSIGSSF